MQDVARWGCCDAWPTLQELNEANQQRYGPTLEGTALAESTNRENQKGMTEREREREGQVLPACGLKTTVCVYLNGSLSVCLGLKIDGAPALGAPVSPHHNVSLKHPPNGLEQVLQILPGICKWQALDDHLHCTSTKTAPIYLRQLDLNCLPAAREEAKQQCY